MIRRMAIAPAPRDPVAIAPWIGEARVTCDPEHARRADDFIAGWTAYSPAGRARDDERTARAQVANCLENSSRAHASPPPSNRPAHAGP